MPTERPSDPHAAQGRDDAYVISDERLAEIRSLLEEDGFYVLAKMGASRQELAAAVYDLLAERDDCG